MLLLQPSPASSPADIVPVDAARRLAENGVLTGIGILALATGIVALWAFILWWKAKVEKSLQPPAPQVPAAMSAERCINCSFMSDFRTANELSSHRVFGVIRVGLISAIPNLPISEIGRRLVFTDLLITKFRAVERHLTSWLRDHVDGIDDISADALQSSLLSLIAEIVEDYESDLRRDGMPFVVLEVFRKWHGPRVDDLVREIRLCCESDWINTNTERVGMVFSAIEQVLRTTMLDAETTLYSLNGQLTGKVYKGITIGECPTRRSRKDRDSESGMSQTLV